MGLFHHLSAAWLHWWVPVPRFCSPDSPRPDGAWKLATLALGCLFLSTGCNATGRPLTEAVPEVNATWAAERMGILPGDLLEIRFTERIDWNHETIVQPDGTASFVQLGVLAVGGLSTQQLDEKLTTAYAANIQQYELTVFVQQTGGRTIAVLGALEEPGIYPLPTGRMTLLDALAGAGGVDEARANLKDVHLVRWSPDEKRQLTWRLDARTEEWPEADPLLLQPYDIVYVPMKTVVHVNIWVDQYIRQMIPFPYLIPPVD